jgi:hypothetical protein
VTAHPAVAADCTAHAAVWGFLEFTRHPWPLLALVAILAALIIVIAHMLLEHRGKVRRLARGGEKGVEGAWYTTPAIHQLLALAVAGAAIVQWFLEHRS